MMTCSSRPLAALLLCSSFLLQAYQAYYFCPFFPFSFLPSFFSIAAGSHTDHFAGHKKLLRYVSVPATEQLT